MKALHTYLFVALGVLLIGAVHANYWFQVGARGGYQSEFNSGAEATIQTIVPQNVSTGNPAFWVGETLSNGAFIQAGYMIANQTAAYPSLCSISAGCTAYENISANQAEWFFEYFPEGYNGSNFLGAIGPSGSAGLNGTFNTYGFYSSGNNWNVLFDGNVIGSIDLGSPGSGIHAPVAFGEIANATNNRSVVRPVAIYNFSYFDGGRFVLIPEGFSYAGFGVGSSTGARVSYGVEENGSRVNYFFVGSGFGIPSNGTQLWGSGYSVRINSEYGNTNGTVMENAYSEYVASEPRYVYIGNGTREAFAGWEGSGIGSYTGQANSTTLTIEGNITEKAVWHTEYLLNVSSALGADYGTGWYSAGSEATYGISQNTIYQNNGSRYLFGGWSGGGSADTGEALMNRPEKETAIWKEQYLVNLSTEYGNVSGGGWLYSGVPTDISVSPSYLEAVGNSRMGFYSWSNGNANRSFSLLPSGPISLRAIFRKQFLYNIYATDSGGGVISGALLYLNGKAINQSPYLFYGSRYNITGAYYKGVSFPLNQEFTENGSGSVAVRLPVYAVEVRTVDIFGLPVNASISAVFDNGTAEKLSSGPEGVLGMMDVPYGMASGSGSFFLMNEGFSARDGVPVELIFLSWLDLLAIAGIGVAAILIYVMVGRRLRHVT